VSQNADDIVRYGATGAAEDGAAAHASDQDLSGEDRAELWQQIQESIKQRLGLQRYSIWFNQTELMELDRNALVVGVPNVIIKQYLDHQYRDTVRETAQQLLGQGIEVRFDVAPKLLQKARAQNQVDAQPTQAPPAPPARETERAAPAPPKQGGGFDALIVTEKCELPVRAAREIACDADPRFDFLLVLGDHGVGKTALLRAACEEAASAGVLARAIEYEAAESWCNDYYHAVQARQTRAFRHRYRSCGLFVLDGIQFLQGKPAAQDELVFTVKALRSAGGRVILSSTVSPDYLQDVRPAFRTLLSASFRVQLVVPPLPERIEIAKGLVRKHKVSVSKDVIALLAESYCTSIQELAGAVGSLAAYAGLRGRTHVDLNVAREALAATSRTARRLIGPEDILRVVVESLPVTEAEARGATRTRNACRARHAAMFLARELTGHSLSDIGRFFGGRTHSTAKHAVEKIEAELKSDSETAALIERCRRALG